MNKINNNFSSRRPPLLRTCPHCKRHMEVFDEKCPACHKPSKPGKLLVLAAVIHGHRKIILLVAILTVAWILMNRFLKW